MVWSQIKKVLILYLLFVHTPDPVSQGTTLFATCDNFMKVVLYGVLAFQDANHGSDTRQWRITTELDIPRGTKVL